MRPIDKDGESGRGERREKKREEGSKGIYTWRFQNKTKVWREQGGWKDGQMHL